MNLFQAQFSDQLIVCFMVVGTFVYNSWQRLIHVTPSNSNNTPLYSFLCPSISPSLFPSISPFLHLFLPPSVLPSLWCWGWAQGLVHGWYNHSSMEPHASLLFKKSTFFSRWKGIYCFFVRELQEKCPCMFFRDSKNILWFWIKFPEQRKSEENAKISKYRLLRLSCVC